LNCFVAVAALVDNRRTDPRDCCCAQCAIWLPGVALSVDTRPIVVPVDVALTAAVLLALSAQRHRRKSRGVGQPAVPRQ
jgi:hypothetical protein